jgi:PncC family amidohydrolase
MLTESLEIQVGVLLRKNNLKLVTAESCTGGLIGDRITNIPGSSDYYLGGVIAYAYEAKEKLLGVPHDTLLQYGAVSRETALAMAQGARRGFSTDFSLDVLVGVSVTGIAGPGGGLPGKPVGLTWIGLSTPQGDWAWSFIWNGSRLENKVASAETAMQLLIDYLNGHWDGSRVGK